MLDSGVIRCAGPGLPGSCALIRRNVPTAYREDAILRSSNCDEAPRALRVSFCSLVSGGAKNAGQQTKAIFESHDERRGTIRLANTSHISACQTCGFGCFASLNTLRGAHWAGCAACSPLSGELGRSTKCRARRRRVSARKSMVKSSPRSKAQMGPRRTFPAQQTQTPTTWISSKTTVRSSPRIPVRSSTRNSRFRDTSVQASAPEPIRVAHPRRCTVHGRVDHRGSVRSRLAPHLLPPYVAVQPDGELQPALQLHGGRHDGAGAFSLGLHRPCDQAHKGVRPRMLRASRRRVTWGGHDRPFSAPGIQRATPSRRSRHNESALRFPGLVAQVFAITNYLALFFPRASLLFELIQHMYEVGPGTGDSPVQWQPNRSQARIGPGTATLAAARPDLEKFVRHRANGEVGGRSVPDPLSCVAGVPPSGPGPRVVRGAHVRPCHG